jgi:hypothetical protein
VVGSSPFLRGSTESKRPIAIVEGRCHQDGSAGDTPVERGRTDRDMPGPAGITHIAKRGEASEHIVTPYPLTDKKSRRGATKPEDTHDPEASCHGVEGEIGRFG